MTKGIFCHTDVKLKWLIFLILALSLLLLLASIPLRSSRVEASETPIYLSPLPGAALIPLESPIVVRFDRPVNPNSVNPPLSTTDEIDPLFVVTGSKSGPHTGTVRLAQDRHTVLYTPDTPFATDETVSVVIHDRLRSDDQTELKGAAFQFTTSSLSPIAQRRLVDLHTNTLGPGRPDASNTGEFSLHELSQEAKSSDGTSVQAVRRTADHYVTLPADYPTISVTTNLDNKGDGYLFLSNFTVDWTAFDFSRSRPYLLILDSDGEPVFHQRMPLIAADFKTHGNGLLSYYVGGSGEFTVMNDAYEIVDTWRGVGFGADIHEFLMLPNGNVIIMIYDFQQIDMSQHVEGGDPNATVVGLVLQEIDADRNLLFQWRSWDHFEFTDSHVDLTSDNVDYVHGNSIEVDTDGNWIISSRGLDEITKINRQTGAVMWRLGGKRNQFLFEPAAGEPFLEQHDARRLPNGNLQLFDNRTQTGPYARAVEYQLDEVNMVARRVWEYRAPAANGSLAMGSARRLDNGNTLIGWGSMYPSVTEVDSSGQVQFELSFQQHNEPGSLIITNSYRAFKLPWEGNPTWPPTIVEQSEGEDLVTVYYSWNGATDTLLYNIYAGPTPDALVYRGNQLATGFETSTSLPATPDNCYIAVEPVDLEQNVGPRSDILFGLHCLTEKIYIPFSMTPAVAGPGNPLGP